MRWGFECYHASALRDDFTLRTHVLLPPVPFAMFPLCGTLVSELRETRSRYRVLVVLLPFFKSLDDFVELWDIYFIPFPSPLIFFESKKNRLSLGLFPYM